MENVLSEAAQIILTILPIVGVVMGGIVIFFYLLWNYKQKMFMIEKGIYEPKAFDFTTYSLLLGLLLFSVGVVLSVFFILKEGITYGLLGGLIPLAVGVSLLIFSTVRRKNER